MEKDINYYMNLPYKIEIVKDNEFNSYVALCPELKGCITTGETEYEALKNLEDAKRVWLEDALKSDSNVPEPEAMRKYSGEFKLRMPKSLHKKLAEHSRDEGISMNQYCIMLLSNNDSKLYPACSVATK